MRTRRSMSDLNTVISLVINIYEILIRQTDRHMDQRSGKHLLVDV